jgi:hypothetical protein
MQESEKPTFEENWKSAFKDAEMTPPDRVWNSIELDLAGQETVAMKKRVIFYQRLAAATIVLALLSGVYAFYPKSDEDKIALKGNVMETVDSGAEKKVDGRQDKEVDGRQETVESRQKPVDSKPDAVDGVHEPVKANNNQLAAASDKDQPAAKHSTLPRFVQKLQYTPLFNEQIALANDADAVERSSSDENAVAVEEERSASSETQSVQEEKKSEEKVAVVSPLIQQESAPDEVVQPKKRSAEGNLWLALGAAAGNYTPNTPSAAAIMTSDFSPANFAASTPKKPQPKVGSSYSFGMAVGKKFGRVVIQTGVNLGKQQIAYETNYDTKTSPSSARAASSDYLESSRLNLTNTYTVNSTMEIVSIPVQAGYMIVDRKLGWQLNAGVSPDFFLRNILEDKSGQRERFIRSAGDNSPYRSVNWSGLVNTELSYRIGTHYRLSLVPGVRYSFNSILKEPTDNGRPVILDVGFRFRYLFY